MWTSHLGNTTTAIFYRAINFDTLAVWQIFYINSVAHALLRIRASSRVHIPGVKFPLLMGSHFPPEMGTFLKCELLSETGNFLEMRNFLNILWTSHLKWEVLIWEWELHTWRWELHIYKKCKTRSRAVSNFPSFGHMWTSHFRWEVPISEDVNFPFQMRSSQFRCEVYIWELEIQMRSSHLKWEVHIWVDGAGYQYTVFS